MLGKKYSKERRLVGAAIVTLAISRLVALLVLGTRALGHVVAKRALGATGLSARQRFAAYADLEYAHEKELARRRGQRHLIRAEAT